VQRLESQVAIREAEIVEVVPEIVTDAEMTA
jgi:hypothetical protein